MKRRVIFKKRSLTRGSNYLLSSCTHTQTSTHTHTFNTRKRSKRADVSHDQERRKNRKNLVKHGRGRADKAGRALQVPTRSSFASAGPPQPCREIKRPMRRRRDLSSFTFNAARRRRRLRQGLGTPRMRRGLE